MLDDFINFICDFLSIFDVLKLLEILTFRPHGEKIECVERDNIVIFNDIKQQQVDLLMKYLMHSVSGINNPLSAVFRSIDIFACLNFMQSKQCSVSRASRECSFGKEQLFMSHSELGVHINSFGIQILSEQSEIAFDATLINDMFFRYLSFIQSQRDMIIANFIKKYKHFKCCTIDTALNYCKFLEDFEIVKDFLYLSDSLKSAFLKKVSPDSNVLTLIRCNQHLDISSDDFSDDYGYMYQYLPFHYYDGIDESTLEQLFEIISWINSLNFWKRYSEFDILFYEHVDFTTFVGYVTSEHKNVIDELGEFLYRFNNARLFMNQTEDVINFDGGETKFNVNMRCFDSVIGDLKSCNGTSETEDFPPYNNILDWKEFHKVFLKRKMLTEKFDISRSVWIENKRHIQIGTFIEGFPIEIACLYLPGICSDILGYELNVQQKMKLGTFVVKKFERRKIPKGSKLMCTGEFNTFNMYDCSEKTYSIVREACEDWIIINRL
jgi:hypothetical protein